MLVLRRLGRHGLPGRRVSVLQQHIKRWSVSAALQPNYEREEAIRSIRNIGIIAHIDAGKTTTTERMLYLVGGTRHEGSVDTGDTVTDFMTQERERGITIQSAAVNFQWGDHHINVIDTPGHVDFSIEVERCMRVLDGAVLIVDAVAGVQAQTETVWQTASRTGVPALAFINKMDREGADMQAAVASLQKRLGVNAIPVQIPIGSEGAFCGAVDLLTMRAIVYDEAKSAAVVQRIEVDELEQRFPGITRKAEKERTSMIEALAGVDEEFMEKYLEGGDGFGSINGGASLDDILGSLRRACLSRAIVPIVCGAALRGVGVEPLLDCITAFLPSPLDRPPPIGHICPAARAAAAAGAKVFKASKKKRAPSAIIGTSNVSDPHHHHHHNEVAVNPLQDELSALAFKVSHDSRRGLLVFLRVYSGILTAKQALYNSNNKAPERPLQLLQVQANEYKSVDSVGPGQVAAAVGLSHTYTGDTLTAVSGKLSGLVLAGVKVPEPVFSLAVEPELTVQQTALEAALATICREDPSVIAETDAASGQTVVKGIGELHLDIVCDRIRRDFNIPISTGRVYVAYKEGITEEAFISQDYDRTLAPGKRLFCGLDVTVKPLADPSLPCHIYLKTAARGILKAQEEDDLLSGLADACERGPLSGFPLSGMSLAVSAVRIDADTSPGALRYAASAIVAEAARAAQPVILEPIMACEISVPESQLGHVLTDLSGHRRATVKELDAPLTKGPLLRHTIHADVPLRELVGYASTLRAITAGEGSFSMQLHGYSAMDEQACKEVVERGY